jgi:predicted RNA-binding protein (virulence factor B family)
VYQDDDKLKATTEIPSAEVGEFAVMNCVQSLPSGAFMDWGIIKDLFIPYKQQKVKFWKENVIWFTFILMKFLTELQELQNSKEIKIMKMYLLKQVIK